MGHIGKNINLFLFDPITTEKTPTSVNYITELVGVSVDSISVYLYQKKPLRKINCYLCKEDFTSEDLKWLMKKWKSDETKTEIWKYTDYTKRYQISNLGRARKMNKTTEPYFILPYFNSRSNGAFRIKVSYKGVYKECVLSKLVAELFVINDDPINKKYVIHKNGTKTDNRANNLLFGTKSEACSHAGKISAMNNEHKEVIRRELGTGKEIGRYSSLLKAQEETGVKYQNIKGCINGYRPTAGSSTWEFEEQL